MVNGGSRCVARLNGLVAVVTAVIVVVGFVGAAPPGRDPEVAVSAARVAAVNTSMSAQWAPLDQFIAAAAQLGAGAAAVPTSGPSTSGRPVNPMPLAATSIAPTGPTPLAAVPTPLAGIPIISDIGSTIASAFWSFVGPLVNNAVVGPFVLFGAIFFGIFVVAPIMYVVQTVQQFFAPLLGLLPLAARPAAAKTVAPTAAVPGATTAAKDPTAAAKGAAPVAGADVGADVVKVPVKVPRGFMPKRQKPTGVVPKAATATATATVDVDEADHGNAQGRPPAPNQLNGPGVRSDGGGASSGAGKSDAGKSDTATSDTGKSLSRNKKSGPSGKSGGGQSGDAGRPGAAGQSGDSGQSGNGNKGGS